MASGAARAAGRRTRAAGESPSTLSRQQVVGLPWRRRRAPAAAASCRSGRPGSRRSSRAITWRAAGLGSPGTAYCRASANFAAVGSVTAAVTSVRGGKKPDALLSASSLRRRDHERRGTSSPRPCSPRLAFSTRPPGMPNPTCFLPVSGGPMLDVRRAPGLGDRAGVGRRTGEAPSRPGPCPAAGRRPRCRWSSDLRDRARVLQVDQEGERRRRPRRPVEGDRLAVVGEDRAAGLPQQRVEAQVQRGLRLGGVVERGDVRRP